MPVTGTAKTVWASITGVPDVTRQETATRHPLITRQHTLINAFSDYQKLYMIGGNAGWANINALIRQSIDGVKLYQESDWRSPLVDVWGISDLDLFKESDRILRDLPKDQPFFAYVQTSGNHRPFTIPKDNDGFQVRQLSLEQVQAAGSRSVEQYNAVRLLDFNIGRLMEHRQGRRLLRQHAFSCSSATTTPASARSRTWPPAFEQLGLESNNVPMLIHAPGLLATQGDRRGGGAGGLAADRGGHGRRSVHQRRDGPRYPATGAGRRARGAAGVARGDVPVDRRRDPTLLLQMQHDGSSPTLHDLRFSDAAEDVAEQTPGGVSAVGRVDAWAA